MPTVCVCARMFSTPMDVKPNEHGEYEVAKGVPASIFRAIMVRAVLLLYNPLGLYTFCTLYIVHV